MKIIVGSTALEYFGYNRCPPKDIDVWTDDESELSEHVDDHLVSKEILDMIPISGKFGFHYATPSAVYTIKMSHVVYDIKWDKTKLDILHLKNKGCVIIPDLYKALIEHWKIVHGNKDFLSLKQNKDDFFTDNVTYIYDHDYLHELVAHPNKPMYTNCLRDGEQVLIDKDKFFGMWFEDQVRMFREEIAVIACERWVLNPKFNGKISWYRAHMYSVRKTVTTLTKGWASRFIVENLEHFVKPQYSYYKHLLNTLEK